MMQPPASFYHDDEPECMIFQEVSYIRKNEILNFSFFTIRQALSEAAFSLIYTPENLLSPLDTNLI